MSRAIVLSRISLVMTLAFASATYSLMAQTGKQPKKDSKASSAGEAAKSVQQRSKGNATVKNQASRSPNMINSDRLRSSSRKGNVHPEELRKLLAPSQTVSNPPKSFRTRIVVNPEVVGDEAQIQEDFASLLQDNDPRPADRLAHFSWLPVTDDVQLIGWYGMVLAVQPGPASTNLVKVRMRPWLFSTKMKTAVSDYVDEVYLVSGKHLKLIESNADQPRPRLQLFPLHP